MSVIVSHLTFVCRYLAWITCIVLVASCTAPIQPVDGGAYTTSQSLIQSAEAELNKAAVAQSPQKDQFLIKAATLFSKSGHLIRAENTLKNVNTIALNVSELGRYSLLYADIALQDDRYFLAKTLLQNKKLLQQYKKMPVADQQHWHSLRGDIFALLGESVTSVREYIALSNLLDNPQKITAVHDNIWQTLGLMSTVQINTAATNTTDEILAGWYHLAQVIGKTQGDINQQMLITISWQQQYPQHPATLTPPSFIQHTATASANLPRNLALLLPLTGNYAQAGETIRDGFLSTYYVAMERQGLLPTVRFYNTEDGRILQHYQQAVDDGADLVIGPLRKEHVQALIASARLPIPVLALNSLADITNPHNNLYQFGLSVADEARQAAHQAWLEGHRSALVITPDSRWGDTARDAFSSFWQQKGGTFISAPYQPNSPDYAPVLKPALLIHQSEERAQKLTRTLGKKLSFTPRRRKDIDAIFLTAHPQEGRQIKPTLDFLYASNIPIYATSHIYNGSPQPSQNRDLEGIRFSATPWAMPAFTPQTLNFTSDISTAYRNLFAMGADSYKLHQWLTLMQQSNTIHLNGYTGSLTLGEENHIKRTLPWAMFKRSKAVAATFANGQ